MRDRTHLISAEVEKLLTATTGTRHETRDRCRLLLMFRQGLRVSEACSLVLFQVDTESRVLHRWLLPREVDVLGRGLDYRLNVGV